MIAGLNLLSRLPFPPAQSDAAAQSRDRPVHGRPRCPRGLRGLTPAAGAGPADWPQRVSTRGRHRSRDLWRHDRIRRRPPLRGGSRIRPRQDHRPDRDRQRRCAIALVARPQSARASSIAALLCCCGRPAGLPAYGGRHGADGVAGIGGAAAPRHRDGNRRAAYRQSGVLQALARALAVRTSAAAVVGPAMNTVIEAFRLVLQTDVFIAILLSSIYGLVVGSLPGLSATMATALLVPVTFYLSPIAAVATIIAASAMAIFSGDIPGALLRIPGTPASAAYTDEAYAMTRKGQPEMALGAGVWFSAVGGIAGTLSLMILAPPLAEIALSFSTFEYFWLAFLGLMCATLVARSSPVKAIAAMLLGLLVSCIGIENPGGVPRFTFGFVNLFGGIEPIPALVGVFAVAQVMRAMI